MSKALVLIDIQNDYFPGGKMELSDPIKAGKRAREILEWFRGNNPNIFHIQHISNGKGAGFFLPDTDGIKINKDVLPLKDESIIVKHTPNSFFQTQLESKLRESGVTNLVICGMMTHMCIDATVRAAKELGFECTLIEDACTTKDLTYQDRFVPAAHVHNAFISALNGRYANVLSAQDYLQQVANTTL